MRQSCVLVSLAHIDKCVSLSERCALLLSAMLHLEKFITIYKNSMEKVFTVNSIKYSLDSPTSNFIEWSLIDERHQQRVVKGKAELTVQGYVKEIVPFNRRELPLIEALTEHKPGESFGVDFTHFNKNFGYQNRVYQPKPEAPPPPPIPKWQIWLNKFKIWLTST